MERKLTKVVDGTEITVGGKMCSCGTDVANDLCSWECPDTCGDLLSAEQEKAGFSCKTKRENGRVLQNQGFRSTWAGGIMVLLVIDVQKGITDERLFEFRRFKRNIVELINAARRYGVEVIYVRHDDGPGSGFSKGDVDFEIYEEIAPGSGEKIFDKTVNSAFHESTGLELYLKSKNVKRVIAVGLQTDYCVDATVKSGFENLLEKYIVAYNSDFAYRWVVVEKKIGFNKVQICVRPSNVKSKRVIEKCGFEYEGTLRDYFFIEGKYEDRMYYSILKKQTMPRIAKFLDM